MHFRQRAHHRKAEARALLGDGGIAGNLLEGPAEARELAFGNAAAIVGDAQHIAVVEVLDLDGNPAALRRELDRIGQKVQQDLLHRADIRDDGQRCRSRDDKVQLLTVFVRPGAHEAKRCLGDLMHVAFFRMQLVFPRLDFRHVENVADEVEQELAAFIDELGVFLVALMPELAEHLEVEDFGKADNGVERRAQLMAHIGEETRLGAAGGFRPLARVLEFRLIGLARIDVARDADDLHPLAEIARGAHGGLDPDIVAVRMPGAIFETNHVAVVFELQKGGRHPCHVVGMDLHHGEGGADIVFRRIAEKRLHGRRDVENRAVQRILRHHVGGFFRQQTIAGFGGAQRLIGLNLFRHIFRKPDKGADFIMRIHFGIGVDLDVAPCAVGGAEAGDAVDRRMGLEGLDEFRQQFVAVIGVEELLVPVAASRHAGNGAPQNARHAGRPVRRGIALHPAPVTEARELFGFAQQRGHFLRLRDVARDAENAADFGIVDMVLRPRFHDPPRPVGRTHARAYAEGFDRMAEAAFELVP